MARPVPLLSQEPASLAFERPWVKICGLRDEGMVDRAIALGADAVGFVHFEPSPRHLATERIAELVRHVGGRAEAVAVLVAPTDALLEAVQATGVAAIQLHGGETPERVQEVAERTGLSVLKAIGVGEEDFAAEVERFGAVSPRILLDAKAPRGAALPGGNGLSFDWQRLGALGSTPFVLSGGLTPANVAEAVRISRPFGLDVSSGVESAPGRKDAALLDQFFDALARALDPSLLRQAS